MRKGQFIMQTCDVCEKELPKNRKFFRRHINDDGKEVYHTTCKECENKIRHSQVWKDGKLHCNCCNQYKDESEFSAHASSNALRNYRRTICRECYAKKLRARYENSSENRLFTRCLLQRLLGARERARKANIYFDLTLDFLISLWNKQKGLCAISGIPMTYTLYEGRIPTNVSIDKIDPNGGYTMDNVQLVCSLVNVMKLNYPIETLLTFCESIISNARSWKH